MSGQDLRKGSKIQAADGSTVEVAHPPEVSEKRGKVVLQTDKAKFLGLRAKFFQNPISVFLPKRHLKQTSTEDGLNRHEREVAPTQGIRTWSIYELL